MYAKISKLFFKLRRGSSSRGNRLLSFDQAKAFPESVLHQSLQQFCFIIPSRIRGPTLGWVQFILNPLANKRLNVRMYGVSQGRRLLHSEALTVCYGLLQWAAFCPGLRTAACFSNLPRLLWITWTEIASSLSSGRGEDVQARSRDQSWLLRSREEQPVSSLRGSLRLSLLRDLHLCWDSVLVPCHTTEKANHTCQASLINNRWEL